MVKKSIRRNILKCSSKLNSEEMLQYDTSNISGLKTDNIKCRVMRFGKASTTVELANKHSKRNLAAKEDASKPWFFTHV